jgi:hypothetical protein
MLRTRNPSQMWAIRRRSRLPQPCMLPTQWIERTIPDTQEVADEVIEERRRIIVTDSGARV